MRKNVVRIALVLCLLTVAIAASHAVVFSPIRANAFRFTTSSTVTYVDVVLSNPNPAPYDASGIISVTLPNGVSRTWPFNVSNVQPGNSTKRFVLPFEIQNVRYVQVTRTSV